MCLYSNGRAVIPRMNTDQQRRVLPGLTKRISVHPYSFFLVMAQLRVVTEW